MWISSLTRSHFRLEVEALEMRVLVDLLALGHHHLGWALADVVSRLGHVAVIEERRRAAEALAAEELLEDGLAVDLEAHVALAGHVAEAAVRSHRMEIRGCRARPVRARWPRTEP